MSQRGIKPWSMIAFRPGKHFQRRTKARASRRKEIAGSWLRTIVRADHPLMSAYRRAAELGKSRRWARNNLIASAPIFAPAPDMSAFVTVATSVSTQTRAASKQAARQLGFSWQSVNRKIKAIRQAARNGV